VSGAWRDIRLLLTAVAVLLTGFLVKWIDSGLTLGAVVAIFVGYVGVCVVMTAIWMTFFRGGD